MHIHLVRRSACVHEHACTMLCVGALVRTAGVLRILVLACQCRFA